jgi:hypothetical protein
MIVDWFKYKNIHKARSFLGFAIFYYHFIKELSTIILSIMNYLKQGEFHWSKGANKTFEQVKKKMTKALIMHLPDFTKVFEVEYDASGVGIGGVFSQERHPIAYFNEKLNEAKQKYLIYDKEFYTVD